MAGAARSSTGRRQRGPRSWRSGATRCWPSGRKRRPSNRGACKPSLATRIEIPIAHQTLWSTGDIKLWADIDLLLKDAAGGFHPASLRLDSATDLTTFPAYEAR